MNISSMVNLYSMYSNSSQPLSRSNASSTVKQTDPAQKAFDNAAGRLQSERNATQSQISAYGQVKSAFAGVEDSGKALTATKATTSAGDIRKNLQSFVDTYNDARNAASATNTGKAQVASRDLQRTFSASEMRTDMKSLGITRNQDGSLKLDTKALNQALASNPDTVRSAATRVGDAAQKTAGNALSEKGSITSSLNTLNARDQSIATRQSAQQQMFDASQQNVTKNTAWLNNMNSTNAGISSYNRIFSM